MASWKNKIGRGRLYSDDFEGRTDVVLWDVVKIKPEQLVKICFLSKTSNHRQGIRLAIDAGDGHLEVNGVRSKGMELWEDTAPQLVTAKCVAPEGLLSVYNIWWKKGETGSSSQLYGSGMLIEDEGGKRTYRCNDVGIQTDFDKLVFTLELI